MLVTVILAAGKGKRMRSDHPKVLHPLLGAPLLDHVLEATQSTSPDLQVVVVGHGRQLVEAAFAGRGLIWASQEPQLGTGHAAHCGIERALAEPVLCEGGDAEVLVLNGDLPLLRPETLLGILQAHRSEAADVTVLSCQKRDPTGYGRILRTSQGRLHDIVEEPDADAETRRMREINVGTYVFRATVFREAYARIERNNAQGEFYLTDVVVAAARSGRRVATYAVEDEKEIAQVNSRQELALAGEILRKRILDGFMTDGVSVLDPASTYIETGVKIGRDTTILPFTVIERGVEIADRCRVGPFTHLRPGTRLAEGASIGNFVEVKNSTVGRETQVRHLSYVGDAAVGEKVNVGAGTIFANFDGRRKQTTVVGDGAFVGSGTILVAPVKVGRNAVTGAGSVVLRNQDVPDGAVVVGVPARPIARRDPSREAGTRAEEGPPRRMGPMDGPDGPSPRTDPIDRPSRKTELKGPNRQTRQRTRRSPRRTS